VLKYPEFDKNFESTLELVADFFNHAKAEPKKMKQVVDEAKLRVKAIKRSPDELANALLDKVRYGDKSEYLNRLSVPEIKKLKGQDLISEFNSIQKVECNIHYCGNIETETVVDQINKNLGVEKVNVPSQTPDL